MCGRGRVCGCANIIVCVCVCMCVCVCLFPCHTKKGALMRYILYVEHIMGGGQPTMGRCTSRWSP